WRHWRRHVPWNENLKRRKIRDWPSTCYNKNGGVGRAAPTAFGVGPGFESQPTHHSSFADSPVGCAFLVRFGAVLGAAPGIAARLELPRLLTGERKFNPSLGVETG